MKNLIFPCEQVFEHKVASELSPRVRGAISVSHWMDAVQQVVHSDKVISFDLRGKPVWPVDFLWPPSYAWNLPACKRNICCQTGRAVRQTRHSSGCLVCVCLSSGRKQIKPLACQLSEPWRLEFILILRVIWLVNTVHLSLLTWFLQTRTSDASTLL